MKERSAYQVYLNIKLVPIFSSGAYLREVEIEKSTITLKYATDAERILIEEVDTPNGISYHGGTMSFTTFGIWGRGNEGNKILKCYTFDLFTLSINIH